jgi:hypothetical protein
VRRGGTQTRKWGQLKTGDQLTRGSRTEPGARPAQRGYTRSAGGPARAPRVSATTWRAELATRFGVILRKGWGGSRTWAGARAQAVLMAVWRICWQQRCSALDFLSQLLRGRQMALVLPP